MLVAQDIKYGEMIQLQDINANNVDFKVFYGASALENGESLTEIKGSATDGQSRYDFDGSYPIFIVA